MSASAARPQPIVGQATIIEPTTPQKLCKGTRASEPSSIVMTLTEASACSAKGMCL